MDLQIGKVAKQFGVSVNTIRHYEQKGLIGPLRRKETGYASRGYRIFTSADIARLEFIRQARLLDLSLEQIDGILDSVDKGCCSSARPDFKQLLEAKIRETEEKMEGLARFHRQLKRWRQEFIQILPEAETASPCLPGATPSQCVFGDCPGLSTKEGGKGKLAEDRINRNIVIALENAYSMVEFYQTSMEEAKAAGAEACRQCYEELLKDAEKAVARLKGLIKGHVERGRW